MPKIPIHFFSEEIAFTLKNKTRIRSWIQQAISTEGYQLTELTFIFCNDPYLLRINQDFLQHNDYTDVITFDNAEAPKTVLGDIFISIDRTRENARLHSVSPQNELCRVIIHGVLHLLGYTDKHKAAKSQMTEKENEYLSKLPW